MAQRRFHLNNFINITAKLINYQLHFKEFKKWPIKSKSSKNKLIKKLSLLEVLSKDKHINKVWMNLID